MFQGSPISALLDGGDFCLGQQELYSLGLWVAVAGDLNRAWAFHIQDGFHRWALEGYQDRLSCEF